MTRKKWVAVPIDWTSGTAGVQNNTRKWSSCILEAQRCKQLAAPRSSPMAWHTMWLNLG
jgi:hypothetical protein